jgi:hypothetical protein
MLDTACLIVDVKYLNVNKLNGFQVIMAAVVKMAYLLGCNAV